MRKAFEKGCEETGAARADPRIVELIRIMARSAAEKDFDPPNKAIAHNKDQDLK